MARKPGELSAVLKVGEVAERTGLTVRTLHHYDEIGLMKPSRRTGKGQRLYSRDDLERLQKIVSLRQLGFSLDEIARLLQGTGAALSTVVELHLKGVKERLEQTQDLYQRLQAMAELLRSGEAPSLDDLLASIKETVMYEKYFTQEQIEQLRNRAAQLPTAEAWRDVAAAVRGEFDKGTPPAAPSMQALARKWRDLVNGITGGDAGIRQGLVALHNAEADVAARFFGPVVDDSVLKYIAEAVSLLPSDSSKR
jgi:DNA-binding transcriptional MerR regulator